jgi:lipopolysaccharide export system protein LptA
MQTETYRGQEKDMIVEAPKCLFDTKANVATSSGPLTIRTADGRFSIEGEGFRWQLGDSRLTSKLMISNHVHSLIRKRLINEKSGSGLGAGASLAAAKTSGASSATNEFIEITSESFEYQPDQAIFRRQVHAHESEGDLTSEILTVRFKGENGALERAEAEQEVVLEQAGTRAQADKAIYMIDPNRDIVEFHGHAIWNDGQRQGSGEHVVFDRRERTIRTEQKAYMRLPRSVLTDSGFLTVAAPNKASKPAGETNAFVEVYSDLMTIQLPPTNGPVERVIAEKSVFIVDAEQDARALADKAVYEEATGQLELTGSPVIESEHRLLTGKVLKVDRATRVLTAAPDSYVKLPIQSLTKFGLAAASAPRGTNTLGITNRFIEIWAATFDYRTNEFDFKGRVRANILEGDVAQGKLTCESLTIRYGQQIESVLAEQNVELEQFAAKGDPKPVTRKMQCPWLKLDFSPEGRLRTAVADQGVAAEQEEVHRGSPSPILSHLTSKKVTAYFSAVTNRIDRVIAEKDVVFSQDDRTAQGAQAVYTGLSGLMELTGQPKATMPEGKITQADRLIWDRVHQRFFGRGKFKSEWKKPPGVTNQLTNPTALAK